jgi:hypothetical protein
LRRISAVSKEVIQLNSSKLVKIYADDVKERAK